MITSAGLRIPWATNECQGPGVLFKRRLINSGNHTGQRYWYKLVQVQCPDFNAAPALAIRLHPAI